MSDSLMTEEAVRDLLESTKARLWNVAYEKGELIQENSRLTKNCDILVERVKNLEKALMKATKDPMNASEADWVFRKKAEDLTIMNQELMDRIEEVSKEKEKWYKETRRLREIINRAIAHLESDD